MSANLWQLVLFHSTDLGSAGGGTPSSHCLCSYLPDPWDFLAGILGFAIPVDANLEHTVLGCSALPTYVQQGGGTIQEGGGTPLFHHV